MLATQPSPQTAQDSERDPGRRAAGPRVAIHRLAQVLARVARSPAAWFFAAIWVAAELVLFATDLGSPIDGILFGLAYLLVSLLTVAMTDSAAEARAAGPAERRRIWLQLGLVLLFVLLTAWRGLQFHNVVGAESSIPLWSPLVAVAQRLGDDIFGQGNWVANPVTYVLLPLPALLLAGARLSSLGFGRGRQVGRVLLVWSVVPVLLFAYVVLAGQLTLGRLAGQLVNNAMSNGFFEEFLFRGALQTRLGQLWSPAWGLVVQALVFGAWHLGLGFDDTAHVGWLPALASTLVHQAVMGLAFGVIFKRTRNLLAPSVAHVLVNSMGI